MQGFRHFIDENIYECNEYTHVKICTRENNEWQCAEMIVELKLWWNYGFFSFFQISLSFKFYF